MKTKNQNTNDLKNNIEDQTNNQLQRKKKRQPKVKYNHKAYWLEMEDDYELPKYKDEEE